MARYLNRGGPVVTALGISAPSAHHVALDYAIRHTEGLLYVTALGLRPTEVTHLDPGLVCRDPNAVGTGRKRAHENQRIQDDLLAKFEFILARGRKEVDPLKSNPLDALILTEARNAADAHEADHGVRAQSVTLVSLRPRLVFNDASRTAALDGRTDDEPLSPVCYYLLKALGTPERLGTMVPGNRITGPVLAGKKLARVVKSLPAKWRRLVPSKAGSGGGYCLTLPDSTRP